VSSTPRWGILRAAVAARGDHLHLIMRYRLARYQRDQLALARRYEIEGCEPETYDEDTQRRIERLARACTEPYDTVWTSGSTHHPKQLFYPRSRASRLQLDFLSQVLLAFDHLGVDRLTGYFLTGLGPDRSLSKLLARRRPPWLLRMIALRGSLGHLPQAETLAAQFSQEAVHLILLGLAAPTMIAMVNPSALSVWLDRMWGHWDRIRDEARGLLATDLLPAARAVLGGAAAPREARLRLLLDRSEAPPARELLPDVRIIYSWDGGYVQPFIERLRGQLADLNPRFYPMFSLSTETVAYEIYPRVSTVAGLPIYPGVCYEFLAIDGQPSASELRKPWDLDADQSYEMVVSDAYGLLRYRTGDVFACHGFEGRAPLLRFAGRAGLTYSFTGEKLTAEQLQLVYERIGKERGVDGAVFTCFPTLNAGGVPGYVFVGCPTVGDRLPDILSPAAFDDALSEINQEYAAKRHSGRLAPPTLVAVGYDRLSGAIMGSDGRFTGSNLQQFKLLPLYQTNWETVAPLHSSPIRTG
jgi:hypothetical protein